MQFSAVLKPVDTTSHTMVNIQLPASVAPAFVSASMQAARNLPASISAKL